MSIIGDIFYIGENGVEQDYKKAFEWYERATKQSKGNMAKIKRTLLIYHGSGGVNFEDGEGDTYKLEAAKKIMWMYELGERIPQDKEKAAEWRSKIEELERTAD